MRLGIVLLLLIAAPAAAARPEDGRLDVAFVVWDGMELIESMGPAHVFAFAPGMDEYTVSGTTEPVTSEFVTIVPQYGFDECPPPDVIVIPGGSIWKPMTDEAYRRWLQRCVPEATLTLSVCNSAILLADLGLLDGREATCGDANLDDIMLLGDDVKGYINRRWVHSGNIITSESYLGGLDAAIYAVGVLRGEAGRRQVLRWSNYEGDLSAYDALHAEPGVIPVSRRREIVRILRRDGVDAAVRRFRQWEASGEPAYTPPLDRFAEEDLFQWMAWGKQRLGRHEESIRICEFKARAWPDSARQRAYLGEALMKAGRLEEALAHLLAALEIDAGDDLALSLVKTVLSRRDHVPGEASRRARALLRRHAPAGRAVAIPAGEPGVPLEVSGTVRAADGSPIRDALVHVYHADAGGADAPAAGSSSAEARLFAFLRTDADGSFEFRTIRPGAALCPGDGRGAGEEAPAHIHFEIAAPGYRAKRFRMILGDDPRLRSDDRRQTAARERRQIVSVTVGDDGVHRCTCDVVLERPPG